MLNLMLQEVYVCVGRVCVSSFYAKAQKKSKFGENAPLKNASKCTLKMRKVSSEISFKKLWRS